MRRIKVNLNLFQAWHFNANLTVACKYSACNCDISPSGTRFNINVDIDLPRVQLWMVLHIDNSSWLVDVKMTDEMSPNPAVFSSHYAACCNWMSIIAQVYRLSVVHCQTTRYSQRVPGYLTRYSVSANEISFDKKISQCDCVFQIRLGLEENDYPLLLVTSTGFLKA